MTATAPRQTFGLRQPNAPFLDGLPDLSSPEETFTVPVEMVVACANANGTMFLHRAWRMGATLRRRAVVWRQGDRLLARVDFLIPVGPENWSEQVVQLANSQWERFL